MAESPSRMLTLLSLLQVRRDWPGPALAERLGISDRTLRRDVERLRELGYRIVAIKGPDGGYRLDAGSELPPLRFDDDQAVALAVGLQVASASAVADPEAAMRALTTVRQVMPSRLRHRIDAIDVTALPGESSEARVDPAVLLDVSAAVHAREVLRFDYLRVDAAPDAEPVRHRVEPHRLAFDAGRWYLLAWDLDIDDWRTYRVDRMQLRIPTGPRFAPREVPGGDVQAFLAGRFRGSPDGTAAWPCVGSVAVSLPAHAVAPFVGRGDVVEAIGTDRTRVTSGSWSWVALAAAFGRFDADLAEAEPRELTEGFGILARRFGALAGGSPPS